MSIPAVLTVFDVTRLDKTELVFAIAAARQLGHTQARAAIEAGNRYPWAHGPDYVATVFGSAVSIDARALKAFEGLFHADVPSHLAGRHPFVRAFCAGWDEEMALAMAEAEAAGED